MLKQFLQFSMIAILVSLLPCQPLLAIDKVLPSASSKEYFTSNPRGRLLIKVQVWGDTTSGGIYHVPDDTNLIDLIGLVGGFGGDLDESDIFLRRTIGLNLEKEKQRLKVFSYSGDELLSELSAANMKLQQDDVVFIQSEKSSDKFMRRLAITSSIVGIVASVLVTYLIIKDQNED